MNPVNGLLAYLILLPMLYFKYQENFVGYIISVGILWVIYSYRYYKKLSKKEGSSIWQSFKKEFKNTVPTLGVPMMNFWHYIAFFIIAFPLIYSLYVIIFKS